MILAFLLALLLPLPSLADAACSGSGLAWTCPAGSTIAEVETAMASATDGATITFASGTYTWSTGVINTSNTKGVTFICEVALACDINSSTATIWIIAYSGTNTKLYRISGFDFTGSCTSNNCIQIYSSTAGANTNTLANFRFDHNRITSMTSSTALGPTFMQIGATDRGGEVYGVLDHNTVTHPTAHILVHILGQNGGSALGAVDWGATSRGSASALFVEDNTLTFEDGGEALYHCSDSWLSGKYVWRYNTTQNCRVATHGVVHGGVELFEVYRNAIVGTSGQSGAWTGCYRCIQSQGSGEIYVFDNSLTGLSTVSAEAISVGHYRSDASSAGVLGICDGTNILDGNTSPEATYRGYPCLAQPGRNEVGGTPTWGKLAPNAFFKNTYVGTGAKIDVGFPGGTYMSTHVVANRDYYNAVSATENSCVTPGTTCTPFDGTTGIGHGTLTNRPDSCTHTTAPDGDEGGGVMYWATDQGSWNVSGDGRGSGVLYRCSATNTWTVHYTPYTYPHPLQGAVASSGSGSTKFSSKGLGLF